MEADGPISLETRMAVVLAAYIAGLYFLASLVGSLLDVGSTWVYVVFVLGFLTLQNLGGPALLERTLRVQWRSPEDAPELTRQVANLAEKAGIGTPRLGLSSLGIANAFAFGRTRRDGRICVTEALLDGLQPGEVNAVLGHEVCHIQSWDVTVLSLLSVVPIMSKTLLMLPDWLGNTAGWLATRLLLRLLAIVLTPMVLVVWLAMIPVNVFSTVLLNYGSRVRELAADRRAVALGIKPESLASALVKIALSPRLEAEPGRIVGARALLIESRGTWGMGLVIRRLGVEGHKEVLRENLALLIEQPLPIAIRDRVGELFSSHPLIEKRLNRLARMLRG